MDETQKKTNEQQESKSLWMRTKDMARELLPIYKDAVKADPWRFGMSCASNVVFAGLYGYLGPYISGAVLKNLQTSITAGKLTTYAVLALIGDRVFDCSGRLADAYRTQTSKLFNFISGRQREAVRIKEAAQIPESALGQKDPTELAQYAQQNAAYEVALLNNTTSLAFFMPTVAASLTQAFLHSPTMAGVVAASVALNGYLEYRKAVQNKQDNANFVKARNKLGAERSDLIRNQQRAKDLGRLPEEFERLDGYMKKAQHAMIRMARRFLVNFGEQSAVRLVSNLAIAGVASSIAIQRGDLGTFGLLMGAAMAATTAGTRATQVIGEMRENLDKWKDSKARLQYDSIHKLHYKDRTIDNVKGHYTLKNVSYTYPGAEKPALTDINLDIGPGLTVITGPLGGGKTTLVKLMEHRREGEGEILLDGVPLTELAEGFLEKNISIVNQSSTFFTQRTIAENLEAASPNLTEEERKEVLNRVGLHEENLEKSPKELSGGQKRELNLAEAIARKSPIIVLDEPLENVDAPNRSRLLGVISDLAKSGRTIIMITHNAQEIRSADRVICIENGQVTQDGKPEDLIQQKGYLRTVIQTSEGALLPGKEPITEQAQKELNDWQVLGALAQQYHDALPTNRIAKEPQEPDALALAKWKKNRGSEK